MKRKRGFHFFLQMTNALVDIYRRDDLHSARRLMNRNKDKLNINTKLELLCLHVSAKTIIFTQRRQQSTGLIKKGKVRTVSDMHVGPRFSANEDRFK